MSSQLKICMIRSENDLIPYFQNESNDLSGESMVTKVLSLINGRLKFLYRKQKFLTYSLRRLLCNALI